VATGREERIFKGHIGLVTDIAFSPDGSRIVSGSADKTIKVWDTTTETTTKTLRGHVGLVASLSFSKDGSTLATTGMDKTVRLWGINSGLQERIVPRQPGLNGQLTSVCLNSDGSKVVFGGVDRKVWIWDVHTEESVLLAGHKKGITSLAFSPNGSTIASASIDHTVRLWDAKTGRLQHELVGRDRQMCVSFSPDGAKVVSGDWNGNVQFWDSKTGARIGNAIRTGGGRIWSISFTSSGKQVALGCADHTIKLYHANEPTKFKVLNGHASSVTSVSFRENGSRIVSGGYDGALKIWDPKSDNELKTFVFSQPILCVSFSPDGSRIAAAGYGSEIDILEATVNRASRERAFSEFKARPKPWWHSGQYADAVSKEDWYAATFHAACLLLQAPKSPSAYNDFHLALGHLETTGAFILPAVVKTASVLPRPISVENQLPTIPN